MTPDASLFVLGSFVAASSAKVARLPRPGESLRAESFTLEAGGKGFNLAVGARRLGAAVDGVLAVGDDFLSSLAEPALARAGLPEAMLRRHPGPTGSGIGFTDAAGETCLAVFPGANLALAAADIRAAAPRVARAALVLAQFEIGDEPILEAFASARRAGRTTLLNPSPYRPPDPRILEGTSILVVNRSEAEALAGTVGVRLPDRSAPDPSAFAGLAAAVRDRGPETLVVTLGAAGALAFPRDGPALRQPAFPIQAVDTLGAGDAFAAALAVGLAEGRALAPSLRWAAAAGALTATKLGVFDALPERAALERFVQGSTDQSK